MGVIRTSDRNIIGGMSHRRGLNSGVWETAGINASGLMPLLDFTANGAVGTYTGIILLGHIYAGQTNTASNIPLSTGHFQMRIYHDTPTYDIWVSPSVSAQANLELWQEDSTDNYRLVAHMVNAYRALRLEWQVYLIATTTDIFIEQIPAAISTMTGWTVRVSGP